MRKDGGGDVNCPWTHFPALYGESDVNNLYFADVSLPSDLFPGPLRSSYFAVVISWCSHTRQSQLPSCGS